VPSLGKGCHPSLRAFPKLEATRCFLKKHCSCTPSQATDRHGPMPPGCRAGGRAGGQGTLRQCRPFPCRFLPWKSIVTESKPSFRHPVRPQAPRNQRELNQTVRENPQAGRFSVMWTLVWFHSKSCQGKAISRERSIQRHPLVSIHPTTLDTFARHEAAVALYKPE